MRLPDFGHDFEVHSSKGHQEHEPLNFDDSYYDHNNNFHSYYHDSQSMPNFEEAHNSFHHNFEEAHFEEAHNSFHHNFEEAQFEEAHNSFHHNFEEAHNSLHDNFEEAHNSLHKAFDDHTLHNVEPPLPFFANFGTHFQALDHGKTDDDTTVQTYQSHKLEDTEKKTLKIHHQWLFLFLSHRLCIFEGSSVRDHLHHHHPMSWLGCQSYVRVYLEIGDGISTEVKHAQLEYDISCLDINPVGENPNCSQLAAVGMWTDISVRIFSLPDLNLITKENLGGEIIPRSVLLCSFEGVRESTQQQQHVDQNNASMELINSVTGTDEEGRSRQRILTFAARREEAAREEKQAMEKIAAILASLTAKKTAMGTHTSTTPKLKIIAAPRLASIEEMRTPAVGDLMANFT
ncbi:unnamed protein product [Camellia sinensis]